MAKAKFLSAQHTFIPQKIINTNDGKCIANELLFRCVDFNGESVPIMMEAVNIKSPQSLDRLVTAKALEYCHSWTFIHSDAKKIHLNVNHKSLLDHDVIENIFLLHSLFQHNHIGMVVELLEYTQPSMNTFRQAQLLQTLGIQIAIDDFGCGYNTLENLSHFTTPDYIKLVYNKDFFDLLQEVEDVFLNFSVDQDNVIIEYIDSELKSCEMNSLGFHCQQGYYFK